MPSHSLSCPDSASRPYAAYVGVLCLLIVSALFGGTTYDQSKHGHPDTGVQRIPELGPGSCAQCHEQHASSDGVPNAGPFKQLLFMADDETLCHSCHSDVSANLVYAGLAAWSGATHATAPDAWWPKTLPRTRVMADTGKCVNCHDPHGAADAGGPIPSMLRVREQGLCLGCHDGSQSPDVAEQTQKTYAHAGAATALHQAVEGTTNDPLHYAASSARRHAECVDCHNPHVAKTDSFAPVAPEASARLSGVSRIEATYGAAGTPPLYTFRPADPLAVVKEYEVCFKCHSAWTTLPAGKPDLGALTDPRNPSYHPVQARGANSGIAAFAFTDDWSWDRLTLCTDCHGSDDPEGPGSVKGPHGSRHRGLLKRPYSASDALSDAQPTDLCFSCHRYEVYADDATTVATKRASRFGRIGAEVTAPQRGHTYHVGTLKIPCYSCHETHGSSAYPALMAVERSLQIANYVRGLDGTAECTSGCHSTPTHKYWRNY